MPLVVKPHHPWKLRIILALGVIAFILLGYAFYEYGRFSAGYDSIEANEEHALLLKHVNELEDDIDQLREEKAVLERAAQIERKAYDELDTTLKVLQAEILELKGELAFYRGIVSPKDAAHGLHLQRFRVEPNGRTNGYQYKVILTQVLKNDRSARGVIRIKIIGMQGETPKVLDLSQVTEKAVKELSYRFRYFQSLEGELTLPSGFTPQRVTVSVIPRDRRHKEPFEKTFDWPT
ncbi:MAG: hypothetical protein PVF28_01255 [Thioalkalispiraceae bacterium]|jgi:hypothetical protein